MKVYGISYWDNEHKIYRLFGGLDAKVYLDEREAKEKSEYLNKLFGLDGAFSYETCELNVIVSLPY